MLCVIINQDAKASRGVVVALNADEYEEGQLEKEIANIEKYHKSGTLHIAETFNRFDKSGLRGIHIPADMPIEYLIYDSFMNPNQMHMSLGEEGKKRKTCTALDVIYYLNFMDDIDELFEYLSYSNEKDYESSFGFGSDAALYFTYLIHFTRLVHVIIWMTGLFQKISSNIIMNYQIQNENYRFKK